MQTEIHICTCKLEKNMAFKLRRTDTGEGEGGGMGILYNILT